MSQEGKLSPEEVRQLDDEWRACRRLINALLSDSAIFDLAHITVLKHTYFTISQDEYAAAGQAIKIHEEGYFTASQNLQELHASRDHACETTRKEYPEDAALLRGHLEHLLTCLRETIYEPYRPLLPEEEQLSMDKYFDKCRSYVEELTRVLDQASECARKLQGAGPIDWSS